MSKKYIVRLSESEREQLSEITTKGEAAAYKIKHAQILLKADADGPNWKDKQIAEAFSVTVHTVELIRQRLVEHGLEAALNRKKQVNPSRLPKFDGEAEAHLVALGCSSPPEGRARWTLRLLADKVVEMQIVESVSHETVRQTLKKHSPASSARNVDNSLRAKRRVCSPYGGGSRPVSRALRSQKAHGQYG